MRQRSTQTVWAVILVVLLVSGLTGCVPGNTQYTPETPAGFFWGIWHGWIAPVSLVLGFLNGISRVYEVHNTGWFYDLGFYMAIISGFGGVSLFRKKSK